MLTATHTNPLARSRTLARAHAQLPLKHQGRPAIACRQRARQAATPPAPGANSGPRRQRGGARRSTASPHRAATRQHVGQGRHWPGNLNRAGYRTTASVYHVPIARVVRVVSFRAPKIAAGAGRSYRRKLPTTTGPGPLRQQLFLTIFAGRPSFDRGIPPGYHSAERTSVLSAPPALAARLAQLSERGSRYDCLPIHIFFFPPPLPPSALFLRLSRGVSRRHRKPPQWARPRDCQVVFLCECARACVRARAPVYAGVCLSWCRCVLTVCARAHTALHHAAQLQRSLRCI